MKQSVKSVGQVCAGWWANEINAETSAARIARAQLRRAAGPLEALCVESVHRLNAALAAAGHDLRQGNGPVRLALIAVALSALKDGRAAAAAKRFGAGDPKPLSGIRFNALIRARDARELWKPLLRGLAVVNGGASAARLGEDIYYWNDSTRTKWCFEYYGASYAAPAVEETIK